MNQERLKQIDRVLRAAVDSGEVAGCSAMVLKDGQEAYYGQCGFANREENKPMARDTIFRMFSMSKPVTAAAAMLLVERGEMDLLDPVEKFLPGFKNQVYYTDAGLQRVGNPATLKDLLGMTGGLVYGGAQGYAALRMQHLWTQVQQGQARGEEMDTVEFANRMGAQPLEFQPGTRWQYGVSADIMGAVIEVITGRRFGDFLHDEIFAPLQMQDTGFFVPEEKRHRFAAMYRMTEQGLVQENGAHLCILPRYDREPAFQSGGAGLVSTIDDYARFAQMLANGGSLDGVRVLSPRTVQFMTQNQLTPAVRETCKWESLRGYGYGNFMRVMMDEGQSLTPASVGEYSWDGWLGTYFCVSPQDRMVLLFMMQRVDTGTVDVTRKFRSVAYAGLE